MLVRVERHPLGPRVHVCGRRVHHWEAGVALMCLGAWLIYDDRGDLRPPVPMSPPFYDPVIGVTTSNATEGLW